MFFQQLQQSSNPNHPSNSSKNAARVSDKAVKPKVDKVVKTEKKRLLKKSRSSTPSGAPLTPKIPSSPDVLSSRNVTATPEPVVDNDRILYQKPEKSIQQSLKIITGKETSERGSYENAFDIEYEFDLELPFGKEQYKALEAKRDDLDLLNEVDTVMDMIGQLTNQSIKVKDPDMRDCIVRRFRKGRRNKDLELFKDSINEFNELVKDAAENKEFEQVLNKMHRFDFTFVQNMLNMVYSRVVSPESQELRHYTPFSNNVYGELLPKFASRIFAETGLTSNGVFVDLGSGVGNCVLQAAMEIGCESVGCEVMKHASKLANEQQTEFENRMAMFGLNHGKIMLKSADFTQDNDISKAMQRADVVLVNNYAFNNELNLALVNMFLDLKEGCKIVSLKTFVPEDHVITEHNVHSPMNIIRVKKHHFGSRCVSWTDAGGVFYVSTIDRSRIAGFV